MDETIKDTDISLDADALKSLTGGIIETVKDSVSDLLKDYDQKIDDRLKALDKPEDLGVGKTSDPADNPVAGFGTTRATEAFEGASVKAQFRMQAQALKSKRQDDVVRMNDFQLEQIEKAQGNIEELAEAKGVKGIYVNKAFYNNATNATEGVELIAPPEMLLDIERYETQYGVAFANVNVRPTDNLIVQAPIGDTNVELYEVGEALAKTVAKPTYGRPQSVLREFAGITVATEKLSDFEVAGFWDDVARGFGRARAKKADELVFTENGGADKQGILYLADTTENPIADIEDLSWSILDIAESLPLDDNISHTLHKRTLAAIRNNGFSDTEIAASILSDRNRTPWGTPINTAHIMPPITDAAAATGGAVVTGDLSKVMLRVFGGLTIKLFDTGIVESGEESINLLQQDAIALRAVTWMDKFITFPERFVVTREGELTT